MSLVKVIYMQEYHTTTYLLVTTCTLFVILGQPVAWLISDREDNMVIKLFLAQIKVHSPDTVVTTLMTDDGTYTCKFCSIYLFTIHDRQ